MLILGRKVEEEILIKTGNEIIRIKVTKIHHGQAFLGFDAPDHVFIIREEVDDGSECRRRRG